MHMADALLSPALGATMCAVSLAANAYAIKEIKTDELCEQKIPVMGVMGAFVFAAQMINFTIPATGSSGHIGGGILLAALLGGSPALLSISAVLIIQCLFFADGGLLALGCNIFNMGVIPCLLIYPLVFKPLLKKGITMGRITLASIVAVVLGLQLGSLGVVLETLLSGITELPFAAFLLLMQPIHLAIGIAEGLITGAVLCFVYSLRPEIMTSTLQKTAMPRSLAMKKTLAALAILTLLVGGALSLYASSYPDGLEWSIEKVAGTSELEAEGSIFEGVAALQEKTAFMPDYDFKDALGNGTTAAGLLGALCTFLLAGGAAFGISALKKR